MHRRSMRYCLSCIILLILLSMTPLAAVAQDSMPELPVQVINGTPCFYYKSTSSSETVYGLSKRLGLTREEIVAYNPAVADGLRKGTTVYFPVKDFSDRFRAPAGADGEEIREFVPQAESGMLTPVDKPLVPTEAPESEEETPDEDVREFVPVSEDNTLTPVDKPLVVTESPESEDEEDSQAESSVEPYTVAVLLPFMLEREEISRPARLATEFYKGFLIAADTLSQRGECVTIRAYDTKGNESHLRQLLESAEVKNSAAIIVPELNGASTFYASTPADGRIIDALNFADTSYIQCPWMVQAVTPQKTMYTKAVSAIRQLYGDCTPVIIRNSEGRNDKEAFVDYLRHCLTDEDKPFIEIAYEGTLTSQDLEKLITDNSPRYVLIPSAGSIGEFNRMAHALDNFRRSNGDIELRIFGYPEWAAFRGDARDMLHRLDATIYSRFDIDQQALDRRIVRDDFKHWYGHALEDGVPCQGLLGYDLGGFIIRNLRANKGLINPAHAATYHGIQSSFNFNLVPGAGAVNESLYIIRYLSDHDIDARLL